MMQTILYQLIILPIMGSNFSIKRVLNGDFFRIWSIALTVLFISVLPVYAQGKSSSVDDVIEKMKTELNLTAQQVDALKPIVRVNMAERKQFWQDVRQQGIIDKDLIKQQREQLSNVANQRLSQVLSPDKMNKWIERENMRAMLNPDQADGTGDKSGTGGHRHGRHGSGGMSSGAVE